jgi:YfiH family protein
MTINLIVPNIFPKDKILAGVTERNCHIYPDGLSFGVTEHFDSQTVRKHRKLLADFLGVKVEDFVLLHQVHSDIIHIVEEMGRNCYGKTTKHKPSSFSNNLDSKFDGDALITSIKGKILGVKIADCAGILMYDIKKEIVSAVHSGWRGSAQKILPKTISKMQERFGTNPKDILVFISPVPDAQKYEVGQEVAELFPRSTVISPDGKYFFDNRKELLLQLLQSGIEERNIEISPICTISNLNLHSYRRDKDKSGRMLAFIGMKTT